MSTDRYEIAELLARLARVLDSRRFQDLRSIYTAGAEAVSPRGNLHGVDEIIEVLSRAARPEERSLHVNSAVVVDVDGDRAELSSNQLVYFFAEGEAPHRFSGGQASYSAERTPAGWRLTRAHIMPYWIHDTGTAFAGRDPETPSAVREVGAPFAAREVGAPSAGSDTRSGRDTRAGRDTSAPSVVIGTTPPAV